MSDRTTNSASTLLSRVVVKSHNLGVGEVLVTYSTLLVFACTHPPDHGSITWPPQGVEYSTVSRYARHLSA